jgi:hypothetical protein
MASIFDRNMFSASQIAPQSQTRSEGLPSLLELYKDPKYGSLLEEIYPDTSEQARKQALGSLLLGGVAPAALRFAQGVPLAEAIEPLPAAFAKAGLQAQQEKQATEQARREGRFKLASDELTSLRSAAEKARERAAEKTTVAPGSSVIDASGNVLFTAPEKKSDKAAGTVQTYKYTGTVPLETPFGNLTPGDEINLGSNELASLGKTRNLFEIKDDDTLSGVQTLFTSDGKKSVLVRTGAEFDEAKAQGFSLTTRPPDSKPEPVKFYTDRDTGEVRNFTDTEINKLPKAERASLIPYKEEGRGELRDVTFRTTQSVGGNIYPAGTTFKMYDSEIQGLKPEARNELIDPPKMSDIKVLYRTNDEGQAETVAAFTPNEFSGYIQEGYTEQTPEKFTFVQMYKMDSENNPVYKTAKNFDQQNNLISQGFRPATTELRTLGNKLLQVSPSGVQMIASNDDPVVTFDKKGNQKIAKNSDELIQAYEKGYVFSKPPEIKGLTEARARTLMPAAANKIATGNYEQKDLVEFENLLSAIQSSRRLVPGPDGQGLVMSDPMLPDFVIQAIKLEKSRNPDFNDYGLIPEEIDLQSTEDLISSYDGIIDPTINYSESIGPRAKVSRGFVNAVNFGSLLLTGEEAFEDTQGRQAVEDINSLNVITVTRTLGALGGRESNQLRERIESLQFNPYAVGTTPTTARAKVSNMVNFLSDSIKQLELERDKATSTTTKDKKVADINDLEYLKSQYQTLLSAFAPSGSVEPDINQYKLGE